MQILSFRGLLEVVSKVTAAMAWVKTTCLFMWAQKDHASLPLAVCWALVAASLALNVNKLNPHLKNGKELKNKT